MDEVRIQQVVARRLAVARAVSAPARLSSDIRRLLDLVWPVLREQGVKTGFNVVVYRGSPLTIEAGVEIVGDFQETEFVTGSTTPIGEAATTTHWGEYSEMRPAYQALEDWSKRSGRLFAGVSWEVYGHWSDDPSQRRTDIYFLLAE